MNNGYWQKLLRIDLTTRTCTVEPIPLDELKAFVGGAGLAGEILRRETPAKQDPYGADNRLIFATGPFQGPPVPGGAKFSVVAVSPVTGTFGDSAAGANWGPSLKDAGYDAVVFQGAADKPVYVNIVDDEVEIRDAADIWELDTFQTVDAVREMTDAKSSRGGNRPGRDAKGRHRLHRVRQAQLRRTLRPGRGDGLEEPQGRRRPRHADRRDARSREGQGADQEVPNRDRRARFEVTISGCTARRGCASRPRPSATCRSSTGTATSGRRAPRSLAARPTPRASRPSPCRAGTARSAVTGRSPSSGRPKTPWRRSARNTRRWA